jgi:hypothetical protein
VVHGSGLLAHFVAPQPFGRAILHNKKKKIPQTAAGRLFCEMLCSVSRNKDTDTQMG